MGFRKDTWCKVWTIESVKPTITRARISISKKNRQTGQYEQDFGGYVSFVGLNAASKALNLKEGDRVKLGDVDVTNTYNREKRETYTNFLVYSFESDGEQSVVDEQQYAVDDPDEMESNLPF